MTPTTYDELAAPIDKPGGPDAALLLHGLTSSPYEMRPIATALAERGFRVKVPRLVGHGMRPENLQHTRWDDWLSTARRAFDALAAEHERVFVGGLSVGALLATVLAHERGARVGGLVAMAPPLELAWRSQAVVRLAHRFPLADVKPFLFKEGGPDVSDPAIAAAMPSYDRIPLAAAASIIDGQHEARDRATRLAIPVLVQHGRFDHVAPVLNAQRFYDLLRTRHRRVIIYPRSWHILPLDVESEVVVRDFVDFVTDPNGFTWDTHAAEREARP